MIARTLLALFVLQGCGTYQYVPSEYPVDVKKDSIPGIDVAGNVMITSAHDERPPVVFYSYGGTKLETKYQSVTAHMVEAARRELTRGARQVADGPGKTIALKVTYMDSKYTVLMWINQLSFQATLGDGQVVNKTVNTTDGRGPQAGLTSCLAFGIVHLFQDGNVRAYLSGKSPAGGESAAPRAVMAPVTEAGSIGPAVGSPSKDPSR
jgi:hypothetical protein